MMMGSNSVAGDSKLAPQVPPYGARLAVTPMVLKPDEFKQGIVKGQSTSKCVYIFSSTYMCV